MVVGGAFGDLWLIFVGVLVLGFFLVGLVFYLESSVGRTGRKAKFSFKSIFILASSSP